MLFNSFNFIFLFLPIVAIVFFQLARINCRLATAWLTLASLFFYAYWNPIYIGLLIFSISCNYNLGMWIARAGLQGENTRKKELLVTAIVANILLLGYYKYGNFFLFNINNLTGSHLRLSEIILPLGISFFTFTQIAFLVDTYRGRVVEYSFIHYTLFVTYFPHLIAGPILHHKEMMPQFAERRNYRFSFDNMSVGLTIFIIGLFKKVILADGISVFVDPVFEATTADLHPTFVEAWAGVLSYTFQLYFDFSGYSDMAIGLSRMFGIILPLNFHSPYKATNIIDFWRRWHMTLSRFLRDYLYIPLGGNRKGKTRKYMNLMVTMLLGGLWHGAGWTFVVWGGLHGLYMVIVHSWHAIRRGMGQDPTIPLSKPLHMLSVLLTFLAVSIAWVFFRADTISSAIAITRSMIGVDGFSIPEIWLHQWGAFGQKLIHWGITFSPPTCGAVSSRQICWIFISFLIVWLTPNTQQIMHNYKPALEVPNLPSFFQISWRPIFWWSVLIWIIGLIAIINFNRHSDFLYFQF